MTTVYRRLAACTRNSGSPCQMIAPHTSRESRMPDNVTLNEERLLNWKRRMARNHRPVVMP